METKLSTPSPAWLKFQQFLTFLAYLMVIPTLYTYFTSLSQYATADQRTTLTRHLNFAFQRFQYDISMGSNVGNWIAGVPGILLNRILLKFYSPQAQIIPGIYFTEYLPYAVFMVFFSLVMIILGVRWFGKLQGWEYKKDKFIYLLCFLLLANLPIVKGMAKVVKYDAFSLLLATLALLKYFDFLKTEKAKSYSLAIILCSLAYFEKETTIPVTIAIVGYECLRLCFSESASLAQTTQKLLWTLLKSGLLFFFSGWLLMPSVWLKPWLVITIIPKELGLGHFTGTQLGLILGAALFLLLAVAASKQSLLPLYRKIAAPLPMVWVLLIGDICLALAWAFQNNEFLLVDYLPLSRQKQIAQSGVFVSYNALAGHVTYLDTSALLTRAKALFAYLRLTLYCLPEPLLFILFLMPITLTTNNRINLNASYARMCFAIISLFALIANWMLLPFETKYQAQLLILFTLIACCLLSESYAQFRLKNSPLFLLSSLVIMGLNVFPLFADGPTYFAHLNFLRNRNVENSYFLNLGVQQWVWAGWGEPSYEIFNHLAQQNKPLRVGYDYLAPWHYDSKITAVRMEYAQAEDQSQIETWIKTYLNQQKLDYLIVSKNMAYRYLVPNYLLKTIRDRAVYVVKSEGIEYAWVFKAEDVLSSIRN